MTALHLPAWPTTVTCGVCNGRRWVVTQRVLTFPPKDPSDGFDYVLERVTCDECLGTGVVLVEER